MVINVFIVDTRQKEGNKMKKRYIIGGIIGLCLLLFVQSAVAATTFLYPNTTSKTVRGTIVANITSAYTDVVDNCTMTITSATSGSAVATYILFNTTDTGSLNAATNSSVNTALLKDASDYVFAATCYNTSTTMTPTSITAAIVDNTVPVVSTPSPATNTREAVRSKTFSVACANATSATLYAFGGALTMTESSDVCSYTFDFVPTGIHNWYIIASDGLNSTTSSTYSYEVSRSGAPSQPESYNVTTTGNSKWALVAIVGVVLWLVFSNDSSTKSRRRRR
jgi:hypothetical protein